jgi:uncharacterized protein (DUF885 family)
MIRLGFASTLALGALWACAGGRSRGTGAPPPPSGPDVAGRRAALERLVAAYWEYQLSTHPELASRLGYKAWNDRSSDLSPAASEADLERRREFLARFEALDVTGLSEQEGLTRALVVRDLSDAVALARFEPWKMPFTQQSGVHLEAPQLVPLLSFRTTKDHDDYLARLRALPRQLDDAVACARLGIARGLVPARLVLEQVAAQAERLGAGPAEETPFALPFRAMPSAVPGEDQARLRGAALAALRDGVLPAYRRLARFVREEYVPRGRPEPGAWALPDGDAFYAALVRRETTTSRSPEEIHRLGLGEVARIEGEMRVIARARGFDDLRRFDAALAADPRNRPTSREQILESYRGYLGGMGRELPRLFGRLPRAGFEVLPVEEFREREASGAEYIDPAVDGSRPGRIMVNTGEFEKRSMLDVESTAYHEGVPGHHLQIALQQELLGLPPLRQQGLFFTAFVEGWALYAERLAREVGAYGDPLSEYGRLQSEMLRAMRLVVDTGLHRQHWSREQVVRYMHDHSGINDVDVASETDRYIAWPGQALAYKVGELEILALRERARAALGAAFDLRRFHDIVLGAGAVPLDVLDARVGAWIAAERAGG